jgi:hypothetical protein
MQAGYDIVLTGLPRSGTTLACRLLNRLPNTVALHEPFLPRFFAGMEDEAVLEKLGRFFRRSRRAIRRDGLAPSKTVGGAIPENAYGSAKPGQLRPHSAEKGKGIGKLVVDKDLEGRFFLVVKQPAIFTALLPVLVERFPCYTIVRNPLSVLASWNSVDHNVREGHSAGAELYDEGLRRELASIEDRVGRQLRLLSWWYGRFYGTLDKEHIIRYEDVVGSGGRALSVVVPSAKLLNEPLESRNLNPLYDRDDMLRIGERLLASEEAYWRFYRRESVENLLAAL